MGSQARLGRYELITRIGQGGMAEVQLALQRGPAGFEKLVVVKLVHEELATQKAFVDMLLDEARIAALVKHPNVVDIYDLGEADGKFFIAMEYLEGEPLLSVLRAGREGKRLDALSTGRLIADTADGLEAAHDLHSMAGDPIELVHHDISLGNIVVLYNGSVKLVDFGVAKATQQQGAKGKVQGKFSYMAPEKLRGAAGDRRSDIFSLGCVLWEALTLKRLFRGGNDADTMKQVLELTIEPPTKIGTDIPEEMDPIVMRALERDPDKRYPTAKELANDLEEVLRVRGYGAKNDRIAKYMQETFKDHIDARKKLVQEVVAKGSASAEIVDAAFKPQLAVGSNRTPTRGDFSIVQKLPVRPSTFDMPALPKPEPEPAPAGKLSPLAFVPDQFSDQNKPTEIAASPFETHTDGGAPTEIGAPIVDPEAPEVSVEPGHPVSEPPKPSRIVTVMDWMEDVAAEPRKRNTAFAVGASLMVALIVVIAAKCGGSKPAAKKPIAAKGSAQQEVIVDAAVIAQQIVVDAEVMTPPPVVDAAAPPPVVIDAAPPHHDPIVHHVAPPPPPSIDVDQTFGKALQAYVKGDLKTSLALLKTTKAAKPNHAPTWRLLGQVYKKLGDKANAKASFSRYLALSPNAADAPAIRKELE
ncbi:MAG: protein kinase [Kofleriaceae bacterium]